MTHDSDGPSNLGMSFISLLILRVSHLHSPPRLFLLRNVMAGVQTPACPLIDLPVFRSIFFCFIFARCMSTQISSSRMHVYLLQIAHGLDVLFPSWCLLLLYNVVSYVCCTSTAWRLSLYYRCCLLLFVAFTPTSSAAAVLLLVPGIYS